MFGFKKNLMQGRTFCLIKYGDDVQLIDALEHVEKIAGSYDLVSKIIKADSGSFIKLLAFPKPIKLKNFLAFAKKMTLERRANQLQIIAGYQTSTSIVASYQSEDKGRVFIRGNVFLKSELNFDGFSYKTNSLTSASFYGKTVAVFFNDLRHLL